MGRFDLPLLNQWWGISWKKTPAVHAGVDAGTGSGGRPAAAPLLALRYQPELFNAFIREFLNSYGTPHSIQSRIASISVTACNAPPGNRCK